MIQLYKYFTLIICISTILIAGDNDKSVKFDSQIRVRTETDGRDFDSDSPINTYTLLRARLGASLSPVKNFDIYFQVQDSRAFGSEPNTLSNTANLDVHQAYFQMNRMWGKSIRLRAGRTELSYGNERLIGTVGWHNVGRSFDGLLMSFGEKKSLDLFITILNQSTNPVLGPATPDAAAGQKNESNYFMGGYYQFREKKSYKADAYALYQLNLKRTASNDRELNRLTLGTYNKGSFSKSVAFESEFAVQFGKRRDQDVTAFMLAPSIGYIFQTGKKPSIWVEYNFLSGMKSGDTKYKVFDTIFATNHKFYGFMDYFINIPVNTDGRGLQDLVVKGIFPLSEKWQFKAYYHNFRAAASDGESGFGNEFDFILDYKYDTYVSFYGGISLMLPGELLKQKFANDNPGLWAFLTLEAKLK